MSKPPRFALNRMVAPRLPLPALSELAPIPRKHGVLASQGVLRLWKDRL